MLFEPGFYGLPLVAVGVVKSIKKKLFHQFEKNAKRTFGHRWQGRDPA